MRKSTSLLTAAMLLVGSFSACAEDHHMIDRHAHMEKMSADGRQHVNFPPELRQHILSNMRDHLKALSEILAAMSTGASDEAAQIAKMRLGMDSPAAEGCKAPGVPSSAASKPQPMNMHQMMAQFMPEGMRKAGLAMHQAASDFADEAAKVSKSGDATPAYAALARVTEQCTVCHASYRVQ
jgi:cytochrome c556